MKFLIITLKTRGGYVMATSGNLQCTGFGDNGHEAIKAFFEMFEVQWKALVECDPKELTAGAKRTRRAFIDAVSPTPTEVA